MTDSNPYKSLLESQRQYFLAHGKKKTIWERKQTLKRLKSWIKANESYIISELGKDFKKSPEDVMLSEIKPVIGEIKDALKNIRYWSLSESKKAPFFLFGTKAKVLKEPKGNSLIIAPWNFPFLLAIGPLVSAIAAGCTAVVKPSENTPNCEKLIEKLIKEVFDPKEVACVCGGVEETTHLLDLKWDHIFFTGSPQVGKIVMTAAAKHLTSVTLELGGQNPVIIDDNCNFKDTAQKLIWGKYFNCGQSCISPNYVMVSQKSHDKLIDALKNAYDQYFGTNDSLEQVPYFARVVNENHFSRVENLIEKSTSEGVKIVKGGKVNVNDNYIAPTILDGINTESAIFHEEIFGPVLPIMLYKSVNEAIKIINNNEKPLALYVFSKSKRFANNIINNTSAGTTVVNDTTIQFSHPHLPFGGVNHSGIGKAHGEYGFKEFTNERAILKQRRGFTSAKLVYPPYTGFKRFIIKAVTWWI